MHSVFAVLLTLFAAPACSHYTGLSEFAILSPRFPCDAFLNTVLRSRCPAVAVLLGTFGSDTSCLAKFEQATKDRDHLIEFHVTNEANRANSSLFGGDVEPWQNVAGFNHELETNNSKTYAILKSRLSWIVAYRARFAGSRSHYLVSTGLEDRYTAGAYLRLLRFVQKVFKGVVRAPVGASRDTYGALLESHDISSASFRDSRCVVNEDGATGQTAEDSRGYLARYRNCFARFLWRGAHQGRAPGQPPTPPASRVYSIPQQDVEQLGQLLANDS